jgi:hypothetical protein
MDFWMAFDEASLRNIARLMGAEARLVTESESALDDISDEILAEIPRQMHWKHSSGALADSFGRVTRASYREVGSDLPYARRRNFGFSGRTDSLGRTYRNDPGAFYAQRALAVVDPQVTPRLVQAAAKAFFP